MTTPKHTEYWFTKDLAANIVYAEVRNFVGEMSAHGPSEAELQTLTRRLSYLIDRDLHWCDIDTLVSYARELRTVENGTHDELDISRDGTTDNTDRVMAWVLTPYFGEIDMLLTGIRTRLELAA